VIDLHYTIIGFTAATGEPLLCVVIFKSENEHSISLQWLIGIYITKMKEHEDSNKLNNDERENIGKSNCLPYGPECFFHDRTVSCLV
jgi:hypothetical protein